MGGSALPSLSAGDSNKKENKSNLVLWIAGLVLAAGASAYLLAALLRPAAEPSGPLRPTLSFHRPPLSFSSESRSANGGPTPAGQCVAAAATHASELRVFSQNGEDGILEAIFACVGVTDKTFVEFGTQDGQECNTRYLREVRGWKGLLMDGGYEDPTINLHKEIITPSNIVSLFSKYSVPRKFDLLSIDTDQLDLFLMDSILRAGYRPRVLIVEFNRNFAWDDAYSVWVPKPWDGLDADHHISKLFWDGTCYFGASLAAFDRVARHFSYQLVWVDNLGINAFFVASEIVGSLPFRPATFKARYGPLHMPCHGRYWVDVASVDLSDNLWTDNVSLIRLNYTQMGPNARPDVDGQQLPDHPPYRVWHVLGDHIRAELLPTP